MTLLLLKSCKVARKMWKCIAQLVIVCYWHVTAEIITLSIFNTITIHNTQGGGYHWSKDKTMAQTLAANNFILTTNSDEVIELDDPNPITQSNWTNVVKRVRFPRHGRVSPSTPRDFSRTSLKPRRRSRNVFLILSSVLSFVTFTLLVAFLLGLVKPRNMENSKSCRCVNSPSSK